MHITTHYQPLARMVRDDGPDEWAVMLGLTLVLRHVGYQVAANVEYSLNHDVPGVSECDQVAQAILDRLGPAAPAV